MQARSRSFLVLLICALLFAANGADAQTRRRAVRSGPEARPTSFETIDRAQTEGRISADQAMLYKVFATYDDPRLPQELRGDDGDVADSTFLSEVAARYATLPVELQQQVAPFACRGFVRENSPPPRRGRAVRH